MSMNSINQIVFPFHQHSAVEIEKLSKEALEAIVSRRSIREFSDKDVSKKVIENILMAASSAPSGAHKQPWTFCAISNPEIKSAIRKAAEKEEYDSYHGRMNGWRI